MSEENEADLSDMTLTNEYLSAEIAKFFDEHSELSNATMREFLKDFNDTATVYTSKTMPVVITICE